jgi:cytochrome c oxidase cbb3-type subunit IV
MADTYSTLAYFAQTWGLVYLVLLFVAVLIYALNPRRKKQFDEAARLPLKED